MTFKNCGFTIMKYHLMPTIRDGYYRFFKKHKIASNGEDMEEIEPLCIAGKCES